MPKVVVNTFGKKLSNMKHYRRARIIIDVLFLILATVMTIGFFYFLYLVYPMIPIFD
jgi:hypothetical protein